MRAVKALLRPVDYIYSPYSLTACATPCFAQPQQLTTQLILLYNSKMKTIDLLVIGGGINGCGIARDASGRGLSVTLCEMNDIASATSSHSSKLIHGGLRYLENYEFKLVSEALKEREVLMASAPFLIHPLQFVLPYEKHLRAPWLLRTGLFLYDHLSRRKTIPGSKKITFNATNPDNALKDFFTFGFSYYDCQTDDSRLTLLNALDAKNHGANILTYTQCTRLLEQDNVWHATLRNTRDNTEHTLQARAIINATGPWVSATNQQLAHIQTSSQIELVKGSHIIVPKLYDGYHAYILQNKDNRIVFAMPYYDQFTLIGTTDVAYHDDPQNVHITPHEVDYLCDIINYYFKKQLHPNDINSSFAGVRSLYDNHADNPSKTTREYHLELAKNVSAPYLTIFGGKITTFRTLAEHVMTLLAPYFPQMTAAWTHKAYLPGGDLGGYTWQKFHNNIKQHYAWLPDTLSTRYARAYGGRMHELLKDATSLQDLGEHIGAGLYEHEVRYWLEHEWAHTVEDMVWRRSKLGLFLTEQEIAKLETFL